MPMHSIEFYRDSYKHARSLNRSLITENRTGLTQHDVTHLLGLPFNTADIDSQFKEITQSNIDITQVFQRLKNLDQLNWRMISDGNNFIAFGFDTDELPSSFDAAVATVMIDDHNMVRFASVDQEGIMTATEYKKTGSQYRLKRAQVASPAGKGNIQYDSLNCGDFDMMYNAGIITKRMIDDSSTRKIGIFQIGDNDHYGFVRVHGMEDQNITITDNTVNFAGHSFPTKLPGNS